MGPWSNRVVSRLKALGTSDALVSSIMMHLKTDSIDDRYGKFNVRQSAHLLAYVTLRRIRPFYRSQFIQFQTISNDINIFNGKYASVNLD